MQHSNNCYRQEPLMGSNISGLKYKNKIFRESQSVSPKIVIHYNVKNNSFTVGKPGNHHPNQVIQVKSPVTRQVPPDMMN